MSQEKTRIVFTGDIAFSGFFVDGWKKGCVLPEIKDYLHCADFVVSDIESPVTTRVFNGGGSLKHVSSPEAAGYLKDLGIGIWHIANNHIRDCGAKGILDTLQAASQNDCVALGAGGNIEEASRGLIIGEDIRVGLLSVAMPWQRVKAGTNEAGALTWDCKQRIGNRIKELKKSTDWVVLIVHGGDEYCDIALPHMRSQYRAFLDYGADIVVAHHPHVVQNYEILDRKAIFYSLGNFIFDTETQRAFPHTDVGILLGIDFKKDQFSFDNLPVHVNRLNSVVETCEAPPVFCAFDDIAYRQLWPLQAKAFYLKDKKKRLRQNKRQASMSAPVFFLHELLSCRKHRNRIIHLGRVLAGFVRNNNTELTRVIDYIRN